MPDFGDLPDFGDFGDFCPFGVFGECRCSGLDPDDDPDDGLEIAPDDGLDDELELDDGLEGLEPLLELLELELLELELELELLELDESELDDEDEDDDEEDDDDDEDDDDAENNPGSGCRFLATGELTTPATPTCSPIICAMSAFHGNASVVESARNAHNFIFYFL